MMQRLTDLPRRADMAAVPLGLVLILFVTLRMHGKLFPHYAGWFGGFDQQHYLDAARAWAGWRLDPALHHYPPGYSLIAAPFIWIFPGQPFAIPDLADLAASFVLFLALARRLAPGPGWRAAAALGFLVATLGTPTLRQIWVVPWNSTGAAPFELAALLATLRLTERPSLWRAALPGVLLGILAGIRPSDAALLAPVCAVYAAALLAPAHPARLPALAGCALAGLILAGLPFLAAHLAVHGTDMGLYLGKSAALGFEWRLLPLRWVTLVLDPRPLLPEGVGLAEGLPWIAPGFAGLLLLTMARGPDAASWRLLAAAMAVHWLLYMSYRDLQPYGLWHFYNLHYFKWTFPFLVLAGLRLVAAVATRPQRLAACAAIAAGLLLMLWQPVAIPAGSVALPADQPPAGPLRIDADLSQLDHAAFVPITGAWRDVYFQFPTIAGGGRTYVNTRDYKLQPVSGGAILQPLRPLPPPPLVFTPAPNTAIAPGKPVVALREILRFGVPCGIFSWRTGCRAVVY